MTDDIVIRLRMSADLMQGFPQMKAQHFNAEWVIEAADKIERLRADRDRWRKVALAEHWLRVQGHLGCNCLDEAVRGE